MMFIMLIETENTGKEVVTALEKGKEVVPPLDDDVVLEEPPSGKRRKYGHYHEEAATTHFCKIRIGYMATFKLLTPDTLKVIVFKDDVIEVVTKCKKHDDTFDVNV
ncbi:hypothetical protein VPH35_050553 [Triticum aestivum]